jgi:sporulation protein YlmC with PRC-barrel domain
MPDVVMKSADVQGLHVTGLEAAKLGSAREVFLNLATGRIDFLIVEAASFLGGSGKFHPVPWSAVRFDPVARTFQVDMAKESFKASPNYDRDQLANPSFGWDEQARRYFAPPSSG